MSRELQELMLKEIQEGLDNWHRILYEDFSLIDYDKLWAVYKILVDD